MPSGPFPLPLFLLSLFLLFPRLLRRNSYILGGDVVMIRVNSKKILELNQDRGEGSSLYRIQKSIRLYVADYLQSYMLNLKKLPGEKEIRIARSVPLARFQPWTLPLETGGIRRLVVLLVWG